MGAAGITLISFLLTNQDIWRNVIGFGHRINEAGAVNPLSTVGFTMVLVVLCLVVACVRKGQAGKILLGIVPFIVLMGYIVTDTSETAPYDNVIISAILFNIYFFILGITTIVSGIRSGRLGTVNVGMFLLAALILARFFDSDIGFVIRGIIFITVGAGFLTANLVLLRRGKEVARHEE